MSVTENKPPVMICDISNQFMKKLEQNIAEEIKCKNKYCSNIVFRDGFYCDDCRRRFDWIDKTVPLRYKNATGETYKIYDDGCKILFDKTLNFLSSKKGLLLSSPCGTGKSHLQFAVLKNLVWQKKSIMNENWIDIVSEYRKNARSIVKDEGTFLQNYIDIEYLLIHDFLGDEKIDEHTNELMYKILNGRWEKNNPKIFISSNKTLETIREMTSGRIYSRIKGMCDYLSDAEIEVIKLMKDRR
jgi:DNA replication protein DnaC